MAAHPNTDRTFSVAIFLPFKTFESLDTKEKLVSFFMKLFPDALPLIGEDRLVQEYFKNPTGSLMSLKCKPHFMANSTVILGDAAHALLPFLGQGMNAGFEDCLIFHRCLEKANNDLVMAATEYSRTHCEDSHAVVDLSMYNYTRFDALAFAQKHAIEFLHYNILPSKFIPVHTMVNFTVMPYAKVVIRYRWQVKMLKNGLIVAITGALGGILFSLYWWSTSCSHLLYRILPWQ